MNNLAPVRNRLPTEADWKLNTEDGRARLTISRLIVLRNERINSRFEDEISFQRKCRDSTMSSHSIRACSGEDERRWLKSALMPIDSGVGSDGIRRTSRP